MSLSAGLLPPTPGAHRLPRMAAQLLADAEQFTAKVAGVSDMWPRQQAR